MRVSPSRVKTNTCGGSRKILARKIGKACLVAGLFVLVLVLLHYFRAIGEKPCIHLRIFVSYIIVRHRELSSREGFGKGGVRLR